MSAEVIRSAEVSPELVSPLEGQAAEIADTEEAMRDALLAVLSGVESVQPANQVPDEAPEVGAGILRLIELSRAA